MFAGNKKLIFNCRCSFSSPLFLCFSFWTFDLKARQWGVVSQLAQSWCWQSWCQEAKFRGGKQGGGIMGFASGSALSSCGIAWAELQLPQLVPNLVWVSEEFFGSVSSPFSLSHLPPLPPHPTQLVTETSSSNPFLYEWRGHTGAPLVSRAGITAGCSA